MLKLCPYTTLDFVHLQYLKFAYLIEREQKQLGLAVAVGISPLSFFPENYIQQIIFCQHWGGGGEFSDKYAQKMIF